MPYKTQQKLQNFIQIPLEIANCETEFYCENGVSLNKTIFECKIYRNARKNVTKTNRREKRADTETK